MADIGSLVIKIGADAGGLQKAFADLGGSAKQFGQGLDAIGKTVQAAFFAATTAAVAMTIEAGRIAEQTEQLAQKTGIAASTIEGMSVAMARSGLDGQSLAMAVKGLSQEMVGMQQGTASSVKLFGQLGITMETVKQGTSATLRAIADRFKEIPDGALKAKLAVDLFGRAGLEWIPILNQGGAALDAAMKKSAEFGLVLSETSRTQLTVFDDAMDDLQSALKGFTMQVGIAFAPSITILVKAFTDAIVFTKNIFNGLSDAASTLSIRLAGMVASVQIISQTLLSMNVFSKAAWQETLNHVSAIDKWASSEINAVSEARKAEQSLDALAMKHQTVADVVTTHADRQKRLAEQIIATTKVQLSQAEAAGKQQERMGGNIVSTTGIQLAIAKREEDALGHAQENMGRFIVAQATAAQQVKGFWTTQLDALVASNAFSISQITTAWTSGIANAIVRGGDFVKAAWEQTQISVIQGGLNMAIQWAASNASMIAGTAATAAGTTGIWAGAAATISGLFAAVTASFATMFASLVTVITAVGTFIMGVLSSIATALAATVFGIPFAGAILVGVAAIAIALAASGNLGFKEGGIGDFGGGTPAMLHGPEAVIPLNRRGADFMREAFGGGEKSAPIIHTHVMLSGREIAVAMNEQQPLAFRTMGVL